MIDHYSNNVSTLLGVIMGNLTIASIEKTIADKDLIIKGMYSALEDLTIAGSDLHRKEMTGAEIVEIFNKHKEKLCAVSLSK